VEKLIRAQPEDVEKLGAQLVKPTVETKRKQVVEASSQAVRSVGELVREATLAIAQEPGFLRER
jgi:hypothetical protein